MEQGEGIAENGVAQEQARRLAFRSIFMEELGHRFNIGQADDRLGFQADYPPIGDEVYSGDDPPIAGFAEDNTPESVSVMDGNGMYFEDEWSIMSHDPSRGPQPIERRGVYARFQYYYPFNGDYVGYSMEEIATIHK